MTDIVHRRQPRGSGLMPCCGRSPLEVEGERRTTNPEQVTCGGVGPAPAGTVDNPDPLREQYAKALITLALFGGRPHKRLTEAVKANAYARADAVLAVRDTELQQLREQVADAWQKFATVCGQRDRLRLRMEALAERWENALAPDLAYARDLRAEISIEPFPSCPDPIECGHEAALGQAEAELQRLHTESPWLRATAEDLTAARATVARVEAECDRIEAAVRANPQDPDFDGAYLAAIGHIRNALNPQEQP